ncbi:uncharacterized protein EI90DRAFT_3026600 [Cantharellus anzutake]|uniref:uncharacterized protein n=1 Tax=Cantharellus anzutake TaxID=1750568 RepID=UPI0019079224|nr:uncharacterized protein EI90DRAFT_3026600 [Cantharellus anzutake]KAF8306859.1 hypothetical protein EI90DRAFT_3026600 [Cantharellus anzutake]
MAYARHRISAIGPRNPRHSGGMARRRREIERSRLLNRPISQNYYKRQKLVPNPIVKDIMRNSPQENAEIPFEYEHQTSEIDQSVLRQYQAAQLFEVLNRYNLAELMPHRPDINVPSQHGKRFTNCLLPIPTIPTKSIYADLISFLRNPVIQQHIPDLPIRRKIAKHLKTSFGGSIRSWLDILPQTMPRWAKVRIGNGGDLIRGGQMTGQRAFRDASFVRICDHIFICTFKLLLDFSVYDSTRGAAYAAVTLLVGIRLDSRELVKFVHNGEKTLTPELQSTFIKLVLMALTFTGKKKVQRTQQRGGEKNDGTKLADEIEIAVGATTNIDTDRNIANGSHGEIIKIMLNANERVLPGQISLEERTYWIRMRDGKRRQSGVDSYG